MITRLKAELEPAIHTAAKRAALSEHERTREWLEHKRLPKAARVAQYEAYNLFRKYGLVNQSPHSPHSQLPIQLRQRHGSRYSERRASLPMIA